MFRLNVVTKYAQFYKEKRSAGSSLQNVTHKEREIIRITPNSFNKSSTGSHFIVSGRWSMAIFFT